MRIPNAAASAGAWLLEHAHRTLLALTGGRWPNRIMGMPTLELHTIGRRTGERRSTMLTAPIREDGRLVLVASRGGHQEHPGWYKNLAANPDVEVTIDGATIPMRARTATGEERAELWARIVGVYRGYEGYQRNAAREIPVVVCEPR